MCSSQAVVLREHARAAVAQSVGVAGGTESFPALSAMERTHFSYQTALLNLKHVLASVSAVAPDGAAHDAESKSSRANAVLSPVGERQKAVIVLSKKNNRLKPRFLQLLDVQTCDSLLNLRKNPSTMDRQMYYRIAPSNSLQFHFGEKNLCLYLFRIATHKKKKFHM